MIFWCVAALHVFLINRNVHFLRHRQPRRRLRPHRSIDFSRLAHQLHRLFQEDRSGKNLAARDDIHTIFGMLKREHGSCTGAEILQYADERRCSNSKPDKQKNVIFLVILSWCAERTIYKDFGKAK
uniref:Uncharacterized protein n=1 Tax=Oryza barthii TaxID=65489 RepID=A0A0D3G8R1_9ORYZ